MTWVGTEVNPTTRTARVRAELANPDGRLRANQFGQARIQVEPEHDALIVPRAAVQDDGTIPLVFLPLAETVLPPATGHDRAHRTGTTWSRSSAASTEASGSSRRVVHTEVRTVQGPPRRGG